jgi:hypothetical protein
MFSSNQAAANSVTLSLHACFLSAANNNSVSLRTRRQQIAHIIVR